MPNKFDRRSIRLKGYDYSNEGLYFVTICCQNMAHLFGKVVNGQMQLNAAGLMVNEWIKKLENKFLVTAAQNAVNSSLFDIPENLPQAILNKYKFSKNLFDVFEINYNEFIEYPPVILQQLVNNNNDT